MTRKQSYTRFLQSLYSLRRFGIKLGLDTIRELLENLGNPQSNLRIIHIAGTNGKGSIASALESILRTCGYRTGLYTSPHLVRFNERIRIDNRPITDQQVIDAHDAVRSAQKDMCEATFFEYTTAMAFYEFDRRKVDYAIIETGMGGRLDATNIVDPAITIISNIALEHQQYLGSTLREIAAEKGGIIKPGMPVVTGVRQKTAMTVLEEISKERSAPLYCSGRQFNVEKHSDETFTYAGIQHTWKGLQTALSGSYQFENAALALAACELLLTDPDTTKLSKGLSPECIRKGLRTHRWPGRLEVVSTSPYILVDGAHNLTAVCQLAQFLKEKFDQRNIVLVTGILNDKPYAPMLRCLAPLCRRIILTQAESGRSIPPETLYPVARSLVDDVRIVPNVEDAIREAIRTSGPDDAICIAGSLYVVGEAKKALQTPLGQIISPK